MAETHTGTARVRQSLRSKRPGEDTLPGEPQEEASKGSVLTGVSAVHSHASSFGNVLLPAGVFLLNTVEWGRLASSAWYCLPKVVLVVFKLAAVAWQSNAQSGLPDKKTIDLDKGAYKFALYAARAAVDLAVAPLWYHFLDEKLFSLTPAGMMAGVCAGSTAWMMWLLMPKLLGEFRASYSEPWNPLSFYGPTRKAYGLLAVRLAHTCTLNSVIDELYFRGFVCRWLACSLFESAAPTFTDVHLSEFHLPATLLAAALYSASHTRFISEVPFWAAFWLLNQCLAVGFSCLGPACISSGTFNLLVGLWIVTQKEWHLW